MPSSPKVTSNIRRIQHFTPATYVASQVAGQKRRRLRNAVSCDPCRIRKAKCDQGHPCGSCTLRLQQSECTYGWHNRTDTIKTGAQDGEAAATPVDPPGSNVDGRSDENYLLENRMAQLEFKVEELQAMVLSLSPRSRSSSDRGDEISKDGAPGVSELSSNSLPAEERNGMIGSRQGVLHFIGPTGWTLHHQGVGTLLSMQTYADEFKQGQEVASSVHTGTAFENEMNACQQIRTRYKGWRTSSIADCVFFTSSHISMSELESLVPDRSVCEALIDRFLVTFNKTHPIVDEDTFREEVSSFWDSRPVKPNTWLPYLLAVLAMGLLLPVNSLSSRIINGRFQGRKILMTVLQLLFSSPSYFRRPDIRTFQIMLLSILARKLELNEPDGSDAVNGMLAIARQVAYSMGLHRDVSNKPGVSTTDFELRRKLWTTFIFVDLEHSVQSGMPFLLRMTDFQTRSLLGSSHTESPYVYCIHRALPIWIEIVQAANSCTLIGPSPLIISGMVEQLRELTAIINERLPAGFWSSSVSSPEVTLILEVQRSILHCFNNRMLMILQILLVQNPLSSTSRNATLTSAVTVLEHASLLANLVRTCADDLQDAWRHFVVSELYCQFSYASIHILHRIRRILQAKDTPLPSVCQTHHGTTKYDLITLHEFVEKASSISDGAVHHSPSAVKGNMFFKGLCADIRERLRLANVHLSGTHGTSADHSAGDIREIFSAMRRAMNASLEVSRMAIDRAVRSSDPPPLLCEEAEDRGHESDGNGQIFQAANLAISDSSGDTEIEVQSGDNMVRKFMLSSTFSLLDCWLWVRRFEVTF
ncbi:hypothetical protein V1509DRAFT_675453 [Lipomyces kononenkoae]